MGIADFVEHVQFLQPKACTKIKIPAINTTQLDQDAVTITENTITIKARIEFVHLQSQFILNTSFNYMF